MLSNRVPPIPLPCTSLFPPHFVVTHAHTSFSLFPLFYFTHTFTVSSNSAAPFSEVGVWLVGDCHLICVHGIVWFIVQQLPFLLTKQNTTEETSC